MLFVCVRGVMDVVFFACILTCGAVVLLYAKRSMCVSSCRCCKFVSCVHPVAVLNAAFCMTCSLLMLVECVLYVSFGSKVRPRTFGCVAMRSAVLFIFRSRLLLYSAVNRVQVVLSGFSMRLLFCFVQVKPYVGMVVCISLLHSCLCV